MSNLGGSVAFTVSAILFAIAATVLAFIFIVPEKRREKLNAFGKFLHDTCNFKYLVVEKLLQALYIFATSLVILNGFFMLFQAPYGHWLGGYGLIVMIIGPIALRLVYELLMMMVLLVKNVIMINKKLKDQTGNGVIDEERLCRAGYERNARFVHATQRSAERHALYAQSCSGGSASFLRKLRFAARR